MCKLQSFKDGDLKNVSEEICLRSAHSVHVFFAETTGFGKQRLMQLCLRLELIMWNLLIFQLSAAPCPPFDANVLVFT